MTKNIKAVVFDMDGVLLDSESVCDIIWKELAKDMRLPDIEAAIAENRGCNVELMAAQLKARYGAGFDCPKFFGDFSVRFKEWEFTKGIPLMPTARETLDWLKGKGCRLALATSTDRETAVRQLTAVGVYDYFEACVFGDQIERSKPAPDIYQKAAALLGLEPSECAAIEDSPNGIKSAAAAGLLPIMVPDRIQPGEDIKKLCFKIGKPLSFLRDFM